MFNDKFGRERPAFAWYGGPGGPGGDESEMGWQPWAPGWRQGPPPRLGRMFWRMARRFPFGPGFGPGMGPGGPRMFGHGDLKYILLELLVERPKHGYEMIKELQDRSSGFYTPSAGAIYPTLQMLEDREWVTSQSQDGKKVYALTDAGRAALQEQQQHRQEHEQRHERGPRRPGGPEGDPDGWGWGRRRHGWGGPFGGGPFGREARPELGALVREGMEVARLMRAAVLASDGDPERLSRLRAIVERAKNDLNVFLGQPTTASGSDTPASEGPIESV
jgi:DNA-binding PadR family transcriptional regulator